MLKQRAGLVAAAAAVASAVLTPIPASASTETASCTLRLSVGSVRVVALSNSLGALSKEGTAFIDGSRARGPAHLLVDRFGPERGAVGYVPFGPGASPVTWRFKGGFWQQLSVTAEDSWGTRASCMTRPAS